MVGRWAKEWCEGRLHRRTLEFSTLARGDIGNFVILTEDIEISKPSFRACEILASLVWMRDESEGRSRWILDLTQGRHASDRARRKLRRPRVVDIIYQTTRLEGPAKMYIRPYLLAGSLKRSLSPDLPQRKHV